MVKQIIISICIINLLWGAADLPQWVENYQHPKYPQSMYFLGVGIGETKAQASERAKADLLKQIKVKIESQLITEETEIRERDKSYLNSRVQDRTESTVKASVSGLRVAEMQKNEGRFYALSVLNKSNYIKTLKNQMEQIISNTHSLLRQSRENVNRGHIYSAIKNYRTAQNTIPEFYIKNNLLTSISGQEYGYEQKISAQKIMTEMRTLVANIELEAISGRGQTAQSGNYLPEPIIVRVIYDSIGVKNFPVHVRYQNGEKVGLKSTDKTGKVNFEIKAIATDRTASGAVDIKLSDARLPSNLKELLSDSKIYVKYNIIQPDLEYSLDISGERGWKLDPIRNKIEQTITQNGYSIDEKAQLMIRGKTQLLNERVISSALGDQYMVNLGIDLKLINTKNDKVLGTYGLEGKGLSAESKQEAAEAALRRIKINQQEFLGFLNKGK